MSTVRVILGFYSGFQGTFADLIFHFALFDNTKIGDLGIPLYKGLTKVRLRSVIDPYP